MKNLTLLVIVVLNFTLAHSQMFDLPAFTFYSTSSGFINLEIPVKGGINPFVFLFQDLPVNWYHEGNIIQIPNSVFQAGGVWAIKATVIDAFGSILQRSLLIRIKEQFIHTSDYPYSQKFVYTVSGQLTVSTVVDEISSNPQPSGIETITDFPTNSQLDTLFNSGDSASITQTVQRVIKISISCNKKSGYLNGFLGRMHSCIAIKQSMANQFNNMILTTQNQIAQLNKQIASLTTSINNLGIPNLQKQLTNTLTNLQEAYDSYNKANLDTTSYKTNIATNSQTINSLSTTLTKTQNQLKVDQKQLEDTLTLIGTLVDQLCAANKNKDTLQAKISTAVNSISSIQAQIDGLNADNAKLNNQITQITNNEDNLRRNYQSIQASAQALTNNLSSSQAQQTQYTSQISILKSQIQQATQKLDPANLNTVMKTINSLNTAVPYVRQQVDYTRFNCYGVLNYTVTSLDGTFTYTFGSSVFFTFATNQFGQSNSNTIQKLLGPISKGILTPITIFAPTWTQQFGQAFANDLKSISAAAATATPITYFFNSDFSCTETNIQQGSGVIKRIIANYIAVALPNGSLATIVLGACSSILLLNQSAPKIGNNIYWSGVSAGRSTFNAYSVLLF